MYTRVPRDDIRIQKLTRIISKLKKQGL